MSDRLYVSDFGIAYYVSPAGMARVVPEGRLVWQWGDDGE